MKYLLNLILFFFPILVFSQEAKTLKLWYQQPAAKWTEALPLGNGRLGAMIHGRTDQELFQLNEESVWAGSQINNNNPGSAFHLNAIQEAIFQNKFEDAKDLASRYMVGTPARIRSYQPLGNLKIFYNWGDEKPEKYSRTLNLNTGIHETNFTMHGNQIHQKSFISAVDDAMVMIWESEHPISFKVQLDRSRDVQQYGNWDNGAYYIGQIQDTSLKEVGPGGAHMRFGAGFKVLELVGNMSTVNSSSYSAVEFKDVQKVVLAFTGVTDYNLKKLNFDTSIDPLVEVEQMLNSVLKKKAGDLLSRHISEHEMMFERVQVSLGAEQKDSIPTDLRLKAYLNGKEDLGMPVLFYQYGRYLLMSSSRSPGRLPANLQGIWNQDYEAPWNSDFHTNINLQMNYWPAESGDLGETSEVLGRFMKEIVKPGSVTAKEMYSARGWTLHHLTDPFGRTGVADGVWGVSPMSGPWMTFPIYRHYAFSQNEEYLKELAYPILKGSVLWVLDFLIKSPEGYLVTNPSHSPENTFIAEIDGEEIKSQLSYASTIDIQIIHELFESFETASKHLNRDANLLKEVKKVREQLPPIRIGKNGTIQEWIHDYKEMEPGHRHMSHLLGLYPGNSINPNTIELFEGAKKTIEIRLSGGGGHTGWSKAWIVNFYARLLDGEQANQHLKELIGKTCLPNLFSTHPPFQIDGNFGGAAGFAEMLLQSQNQEIHLLPAIPKSWDSGAVKGIKARGNFKIDFCWKEGKLTKLRIYAAQSGKVVLRYANQRHEVELEKGMNNLDKLF